MVSIIIAVYNGEDYIEETIKSALKQTISKEIIIIDDCSTDGSFSLIEELLKKNPCIHLYKNEHNIGFCKTVNNGLKRVKGEYVLVLGQDDILLPNHCELMQKYFIDRTSLVFCDYNLIDGYGNVYETKNHCQHSDKTIKDLYKENSIPSVGLIMDTEKLKNVGGYPENEEFPQYGEYHTWIRLALIGDVVFCDEIRSKYRRHKNNMTNSFNEKKNRKKLNRYFNACKKQILVSKEVALRDKVFLFLHMCYRTLRASI